MTWTIRQDDEEMSLVHSLGYRRRCLGLVIVQPQRPQRCPVQQQELQLARIHAAHTR